ncbi:unnamed protein product [Strongylus vulgaris]|uniref:Uncharacterized protein n=1 Tax=Strongylus vulgaris TaxID=40348 RepID=A0A3P7IKV4_STRVU|nr:unnamed protein product [Strongylus vulgaris]
MVLRDPRACRALLAPCTTFRRIVWTSADNITVVVQLVQLVAQPGIRQDATKIAYLVVSAKFRIFLRTEMILCIRNAFFHHNVRYLQVERIRGLRWRQSFP